MIKTEKEWKKELTPEQYRIMREKGTEAPFTGKYVHEKGTGTYMCAACGNPLFASDTKFDSGTGWPSFDQALPSAVEFKKDIGGGMERTEVLCAKCDSHLGHLFDDLPAPRHIFSIYVIKCENDSFYIGQTDNLLRRWRQHKQGKASWTRKCKPVEVIHHETFKTRAEAVRREKDLKTGFGRKWLKSMYEKKHLNRWNEDMARQAGGPTKTGKRFCLNSVCLNLKKR